MIFSLMNLSFFICTLERSLAHTIFQLANGTPIVRYNCVKNLGVHVSSSLSKILNSLCGHCFQRLQIPRVDPKDLFNSFHYSKETIMPHTGVISTDLL